MKTIIRLILFFVCMGFFFSSCNKEFLDKPPLGIQVATNFLVTDSNAYYATIAVYNVIRAEETYSESEWVFGDVASDDAESGGQKGGSDPTTTPLYLDRLNILPSNGLLETYWSGMFTGIYRANVIINYLDTIKVSKKTAHSCLGEAFFLRAMMYFDLVKVFGGVPLPPSTGFLTGKEARSSIKETYNFVEADLKKAINLLPAKRPLSEEGRVTSGAAKALLTKLYVFESSYAELSDPNGVFTGCTNRWKEAQNMAEDIINNKAIYGYDLDPVYNNLFHFVNDVKVYSPEYVFIVNSVRKVNYGFPDINYDGTEWGTLGGIGSAITTWQCCRGYYNSGGKVVDDYNLGYGFNCPTKELFNAFNHNDPRFRATILQDKIDSVQRLDATSGTLQWFKFSTDASSTGYNNKKYSPITSVERGDAQLDGTNGHVGNLDVKLIRYADVILWAAEASFKNGDVAKATTYVNQIRARARNSVTPASTEPADYSTVTIDDIYNERRLELALEGHRYFDLVRTGKAYASLNGQINSLTGLPLEFVQYTYNFFPIPATEITMTNNILKQNPGY